MIRVIILGFGNVGQHLFRAFSKSKEIEVIQIYNRSNIEFPEGLQTNFTTDIQDVKEAEIYIISVPDDSIKYISESIPAFNKLVVHTSGSVDIKDLSPQNWKGVFYPLQTFSKNSEVDFSEIPICIEAERIEDIVLLTKLGETISNKVQEISSVERAKLHLSAVFVNNFVNYLYQVGSELLSENEMNFDLLKPLIKETARKIEHLNPENAQTGPAKRNDLKTIENHLHLLKDSPYQKLYAEMTEAILRVNDKGD